MGKLFDSGVLFDAVVASEDELAVAAIKASLSHGLQVPRDVSIIGYNNSILSRCCEPELTTVDSRVEALCMTAISTLFGVFGGKDFPSKNPTFRRADPAAHHQILIRFLIFHPNFKIQ